MNLIENDKAKFMRQLKRMSDDPVGLKAMGEFLGLELKANEELKDQPIVAVLVPSYKSPEPEMLDARTRMLLYSKQFCSVFSEPIRGSSVVHWVRNDMLAPLFKEKRKFTHVLFLDDDMTFEPDVLVRMLRHDKDVMGTAYVTRTDPPQPNLHLLDLDSGSAKRILRWNVDGIRREGDLIRAENPRETLTAGTGVMLIKREVLEAVGQMYVNCDYERKLYGEFANLEQIRQARKAGAEDTGNSYWFDFLDRPSGYAQSGEDTSFCMKAALSGYTVWADIGIEPGHMGSYTYSMQDYRAYERSVISKAIASGELKPDAPRIIVTD